MSDELKKDEGESMGEDKPRLTAEDARYVAERRYYETPEAERKLTAEDARYLAQRKFEDEADAERYLVGEDARDRTRGEFQRELDSLRHDPEHYMTPGARKYFRRVALGYIILALACSLGIKFVSDQASQNIKDDLNAVAEQNCLGSIPTLNKFNDLVNIQIESNRAARALAEQENDEARVALTTRNIIRLQDNKLRVPNAKECSAPLLK